MRKLRQGYFRDSSDIWLLFGLSLFSTSFPYIFTSFFLLPPRVCRAFPTGDNMGMLLQGYATTQHYALIFTHVNIHIIFCSYHHAHLPFFHDRGNMNQNNLQKEMGCWNIKSTTLYFIYNFREMRIPKGITTIKIKLGKENGADRRCVEASVPPHILA
jgi:hypothetical protein